MDKRILAYWLARKTNCPALLRQLVRTRNLKVLYYILENKHADDTVIEEIAYVYSNNILPVHKVEDAKMMLAELAIHLPSNVASWIIATSNLKILEIMAHRSGLTYNVQEKLAKHPNSRIRETVANNVMFHPNARYLAAGTL